MGGGAVKLSSSFLAPSGFTATQTTTFPNGQASTETSPTRYAYEETPGPDTSGFAIPVGARLGWMVTPTLSVVGELSGWGHFWTKAPEPPEPEIKSERSGSTGSDIWHVHAGASCQYFVLEPFWLLGGVGVGILQYTPEFVGDYSRDNTIESAPLLSVRAGVGYDILHTVTATANRALSLEMHVVGTPPRDDSAWAVMGGVGYQWY